MAHDEALPRMAEERGLEAWIEREAEALPPPATREMTAEEIRQNQRAFVDNFFHNRPIQRVDDPQPPPTPPGGDVFQINGEHWLRREDGTIERIPVGTAGIADPWDEIEVIGAGNPRGLGNHPDRIVMTTDDPEHWLPKEPPAEPVDIMGKPEDHFL